MPPAEPEEWPGDEKKAQSRRFGHRGEVHERNGVDVVVVQNPGDQGVVAQDAPAAVVAVANEESYRAHNGARHTGDVDRVALAQEKLKAVLSGPGPDSVVVGTGDGAAGQLGAECDSAGVVEA